MTDDFNLGYEFAPEHWGVGYGTEACSAVMDYALEDVRLDRMVAFPRPENRRSQRLLEKLGFIQDGMCLDGARNQCLFLVLTRTQWLARINPGKTSQGEMA